MDWSELTAAERLVAGRAVLTLRAPNEAGERAPHGQGFAALEAVVRDRGTEHLREMLAAAANARPEAQKRGPASSAARRAAGGARSRPSARGPS